jgi:hypothetical protein
MKNNNVGSAMSKNNDPVTLTVKEIAKVTLCKLKGKTVNQTSRIMKWSEEFTRKFKNNEIFMTYNGVGNTPDTLVVDVTDITRFSEDERNKFMENYRNQGPLKIPDSLKYRMTGNN